MGQSDLRDMKPETSAGKAEVWAARLQKQVTGTKESERIACSMNQTVEKMKPEDKLVLIF